MATNHEINVLTGKLDKVGMTAAETAAYLKIDQTTPQTITGGAPIFSSGATIYSQIITVAKENSQYTTITAALASITDAATDKRYLIKVMPGTYEESFTMKSYVDIEGSGIYDTIVTRTNVTIVTGITNSRISNIQFYLIGSTTSFCYYLTSSSAVSDVFIENCLFRMTGSTSTSAKGIDIRSSNASGLSNCYIRNNIIYGDNATYYVGIQVGASNSTACSNVYVENNTIYGVYGGIYHFAGGTLTIKNNYVTAGTYPYLSYVGTDGQTNTANSYGNTYLTGAVRINSVAANRTIIVNSYGDTIASISKAAAGGTETFNSYGSVVGNVVTDTINNLTTTVTNALLLTNPTASDAVNTVQNSPTLNFISHRWKTDGTPADQSSEWKIINEATSGTAASSASNLVFYHSKDGAANTTPVYFTGAGSAVFSGNLVASAGTFTGSLTNNQTLTTTETDGLILKENAVSTVDVPIRYSPSLKFISHSWNTTTSADTTNYWTICATPTSGSSSLTRNILTIHAATDDGSYDNDFTFNRAGKFSAPTVAATTLLTVEKPNIDTTSLVGIWNRGTSSATSEIPVRYSPRFLMTGAAWNTTPTAASNTINFGMEVIPVSGTTTSGRLAWSYDNNGGGYTEKMCLTSDGRLVVGYNAGSAIALIEASGSSASTYSSGMAASTSIRNTVTNRDTTANNVAEYSMGTFTANGTHGSGVRMFGIFTSHANSAISAEWQLVTRNAGTFVEVIRASKEGYVGIATVAPTSTFHNAGSLTVFYRGITALRTLDITDYFVDCTANTFTVTLPTAASIAGRTYVIKNSGTGVITIACNGAETIDGAATMTLAVQYQSVTICSDGTNWKVI